MHAGTVATSSTPAVYERWQLYAGLAVVSLGAGGYFGTVSRAKTDEIENLDDGTEFTVAQQLEDEAGRNALYANIGFATALGFGAASLWMLMREDGGAPEPQTTTLAPLLGSDRIGFTANVAF